MGSPATEPRSISIKDMPASERPRERLELMGPEALSNAELLAILLRTGTRRVNAVQLAAELLASFGGLKSLSMASIDDLCARRGVARTKAIGLLAAFELGKRMVSEAPEPRPRVSGPADVSRMLMAEMRGLVKEHFRVVLLDTRNRVISVSKVSVGSLNTSPVHPREIFREAIQKSSAAVILVHNHPSGDPEPSTDDVEVTRRLTRAGSILGIEVLDHVILGDNVYTSLRERKLLYD